MSSRIASGCIVAAFVSTLGFADVTHEEETKMGGLAGIATFGRAMKTKTEVSGDFMRTETSSDVTLVDLSQEKVFTLDPKKKTYTVTTFAEMRERLESAMETGRMTQDQNQDPAQGAEAGSDVSATTDVRVTETGRTETIDGHDCRQFLLELDVTLESEQQGQSGTMTMLTELWVAKDVPGMDEVQDFQRRMAEKLGTPALAKQMFGGDGPQQNPFGGEVDMERMAAEMQKIDGFPLRTVVYFGSGDAARKEAMGEKPAGGGGFGALMKKMTLPGGAGGGGDEQSGEGAVMMRVTTETKKIETKAIDPKRFAVPSDYRQVEQR